MLNAVTRISRSNTVIEISEDSIRIRFATVCGNAPIGRMALASRCPIAPATRRITARGLTSGPKRATMAD